jgi:hypothetical protein
MNNCDSQVGGTTSSIFANAILEFEKIYQYKVTVNISSGSIYLGRKKSQGIISARRGLPLSFHLEEGLFLCRLLSLW